MRCQAIRAMALVCAFGTAGFVQAEDIGQVTLFGQTYNAQRFDYSAVTWPDPLAPAFNLSLIEVEGAHWLGNDRLLLSSDAGDAQLSLKNWVVEVTLVRDASGAVTGLAYVRTVVVSDPDPAFGGFDLSPCGVTINTSTTGLAANGGYLVGNSEDNRTDGYNLDGSYAGNWSGGVENNSYDDLAFCPTNNLVYTINEDGERLVSYTTDGTFVASTPLIGLFAEFPTAAATGSPKGMTYLPDVATVPSAIRRAGGSFLITLDDDNPGLQAYGLDGSVLGTEPLTDNPITVGASLLNQGAGCGNILQLEAAAFDPATGTIFLVNEGSFTDCSGFYILTPETGCPADINDDGGVDGDDVIAFFGFWDANDILADFNDDGGVDGDDVIAFFGRWDTGC